MTDTTNNASVTPEPTQTAGALEALVGEGKKFKSTEDLAKGKQESDRFIERLTAEMQEVRGQLAKLAEENEKLKQNESFFERVTHSTNQSPTPGNQPQPSLEQRAPVTPAQSLTADDVMKLMDQRSNEERKKANVATVDAALHKEFGAEAQNHVVRKAAELGVSTEFLVQTAMQSPAAFYNLIGFSPSTSRNATLSSRVSSERPNFSGASTGVRDAKFYNELKQKMGATKFALDANLQKQMWKDISDLGDRF